MSYSQRLETLTDDMLADTWFVLEQGREGPAGPFQQRLLDELFRRHGAETQRYLHQRLRTHRETAPPPPVVPPQEYSAGG